MPKDARKAILVIHGIGQQRRFETLDNFANGLRAAVRPKRVVHLQREGRAPLQHCIRLEGESTVDIHELYWAPQTVGKTSLAAVTRWIYRTGFTPLTRLAFNLPLYIQRAKQQSTRRRSRARTLLTLLLTGKARAAVDWWKFVSLSVSYFVREIFRVVLVLVICVALAGGVGALVANTGDLFGSLKEAGVALAGRLAEGESGPGLGVVIWVLVLFGLLVIAAFALLLSLPRQIRDLARTLKIAPRRVFETPGIRILDRVARLFRKLGSALDRLRFWDRSPRPTAAPVAPPGGFGSLFGRLGRWFKKQSDDRWIAEIVGRVLFLSLSVAILGVLALAIAVLMTPAGTFPPAFPRSDIVHQLGRSLGWKGLLELLIIASLVALAVLLKRVFVDFLADIALYTTSDERSKFAETRGAILKKAVEAISFLLEHYEYVAIAGHSLGSVISYDAINSLINDVSTSNGAQSVRATRKNLDRLRVLITFGSPLNKVLYFFRTTVENYQTVRAHILNRLLGFRQPSDLLTTDDAIESGYAADGQEVDDSLPKDPLAHLFWLNVYARLDPISAPLDYFLDVRDVPRFYVLPGFSHMSYWHDPEFYRQIAELLGLSSAAAVASRESELFHTSAECLDAGRISPSNRVFGLQAEAGRRAHSACPRLAVPDAAGS